MDNYVLHLRIGGLKWEWVMRQNAAKAAFARLKRKHAHRPHRLELFARHDSGALAIVERDIKHPMNPRVRVGSHEGVDFVVKIPTHDSPPRGMRWSRGNEITPIPCFAGITHYYPGSPGVWGSLPENSEPPEPVELEYNLFDSKGYRAEWLEDRLTSSELDAIEAYIINALAEGDY